MALFITTLNFVVQWKIIRNRERGEGNTETEGENGEGGERRGVEGGREREGGGGRERENEPVAWNGRKKRK